MMEMGRDLWEMGFDPETNALSKVNKDTYQFYKVNNSQIYYFVSAGIHGKIIKGVSITLLPPDPNLQSDQVYNLAFGDLIEITDEWDIDDSARTGNGDMPKVIATVAKIAIEFLGNNANAIISVQGYVDEKSMVKGRNQRNMLYQRAINSNWHELNQRFKFSGVKYGNIEEYLPECQYGRILIQNK